MDRFTRGLIAGTAGGIIMNIGDFFSYSILHYSNLRYLDWASILIFGGRPNNSLETLFSLIAQLFWSGFLGVIFSFITPAITSRGYLLKGAFWGFISGFLIYAVSVLLSMPHYNDLTTGTAVNQIIWGIIWGISMAYFLKLLNKKSIQS